MHRLYINNLSYIHTYNLPLVIAHVGNDLQPSAVLDSWWAHY